MKKLPVRERAIRALADHLKNIHEGNGFNFTVKKVTRKKTIPKRSTSPPEVFIMPGKARHIDHNQYQDKDTVTIEVWFAVEGGHSDEEDTIYNMMIADIMEIVNNYEVVDHTHPDPKGRIVDTETIEDQPFYSDIAEGQVMGRLTLELSHTRMKDNANKWDIEDEEVFKEE